MAYRMTPARRRALRKAQMASARKRRGKGKGKLAAANRRATRNKRIAMATGGLAGAYVLARYGAKAAGVSIDYGKDPTVVSGRGTARMGLKTDPKMRYATVARNGRYISVTQYRKKK